LSFSFHYEYQYDFISVHGLAERSVHRLAQLLRHYGLDLKDLTPEQRDDLPVALKQLGGSSTRPQVKGRSAGPEPEPAA